MSKEKKKRKIKPYDPNKKTVFKEFRAFIAKGNALDLAVGVVIGGAFSAIVTAVSKVLLSICTWGVPGGINGLVTVLPAANETQEGLSKAIGLGQSFDKGQLVDLTKSYADALYEGNISLADSKITSNYTLKGNTYIYNQSATIDWGSIINAVIAFLIIALTLFVILKVATYLTTKKDKIKAEALEKYYEKYPELRPVVEEEVKEPTEVDLLKDILETLKANKSAE